MRTCTAVVIVTAASVATLAVLFTIGWQSVHSNGKGSGERHLEAEVRSGLPEEDVLRLSRRASEENSHDDAGEIKKMEKEDGKEAKVEANRKPEKAESKVEAAKPPTVKAIHSHVKPKIPTYINLDGTWNIENRNGSEFSQ